MYRNDDTRPLDVEGPRRRSATGSVKYVLALCLWVAPGAALAQAPSTGSNAGISSPTGTAGCNTSGTAIIKGNGSGGCLNATSGTDYAPPPPATSAIKKGDALGGFS